MFIRTITTAVFVMAASSFSLELSSKVPKDTSGLRPLTAQHPDSAGLVAENIRTSSSGRPVSVSLFTMTVPVSFSRVDQTEKGWAVQPQLELGPAFVYMLGKGRKHEDNSVVFEPKFFGGATINGGAANSDKPDELAFRASVGVILGIQPVALVGGFEIVEQKFYVGVGTSFQTLSLTELTAWNVKVDDE